MSKRKKPIFQITARDYLDGLTVPTTADGKFVVKPTPTKSLVAEREVSNVDNSNKPEVQEQEVNKTKQYLDDYKAKLKLDTANAESEIMSANRLANQYLQNYLKQQGLVGTGLGQSQYVNLANNYANQMSQLRADEQTRLEEESKNYQTSRTEELTTLLGTMNASEREKYLQEIAKTEGLDQRYLDTLATQSKLLSSQEAEKAIQDIEKLIKYEADPSVVQREIDKLKAQEFDTSEIELYQRAITTTLAKQTYQGLLEDIKNNELASSRAEYDKAISAIESAFASGDQKALSEALEYAKNVYNGTTGLISNENIYKKEEIKESSENYRPFEKADLKAGLKIYENGDLKYDIISVEQFNIVYRTTDGQQHRTKLKYFLEDIANNEGLEVQK